MESQPRVAGRLGLGFSAVTSLLISATPAGQAGLGSGLQNTSRQSGALIAVSVFGSVLNATLLTGRLPTAFLILGIAEVTGIALTLTTVRQDSRNADS
jgi:MFS transporter, DHA2 family, methylenomycin A resistance protein